MLSHRWWQVGGRRRGKPWRPVRVPAVFDGFDTSVNDSHLRAGCARLGVAPVGARLHGYSRRSVSTAAVAPDGGCSWVKVTALRGPATHWLREGELTVERIRDVARPALLASSLWIDGDHHCAATQWTLIAAPTIEPTPWAGMRAAQVGERWIDALKGSLAALERVPTERWRHRPNAIAAMIRSRFGDGAPHAVDDWRVAHGDMQWSNLTVGDPVVLDWESWGLAPRGYDAAYLVATACGDPALVCRLERAFADDLASASGRVARLTALANLMQLIDDGWLDRAFRPRLDAMARDVLAQSPRRAAAVTAL